MTAFAFSLYLSRYSEVYFITHSFRQCLMLKDHFRIIVDCRRVPNLTSCESSVGVVGPNDVVCDESRWRDATVQRLYDSALPIFAQHL